MKKRASARFFVPFHGTDSRYNLRMGVIARNRILFAIGSLWALPVTAFGLIVGALLLPFGARVSLSDSALVFSGFRVFGSGALTLGQVILNARPDLEDLVLTYECAANGGAECVRLGTHEQAHVYQYMALGLFFLPLYFLHGGVSHKNRFEQAADRYARTGSGWWPYGK